MAHKGRIDGPGKAVLGVRPQHVSAVPPGQGMLHGKVNMAERLGTETVVNMTLKDGTKFIAAFDEDKVFQQGESIDLVFKPEQAHLFPPGEITSAAH